MLQSLLDGAAAHDAPVKTLHASFYDFITDSSAAGGFYINTTLHNKHLALACFSLMNTRLKRNICDLANDTVLNEDIPDDVIQQHMEGELQYAVRFALDHVSGVSAEDVEDVLIDAIQDFLDKQLLNWLEALGLLHSLDVADTLTKLLTWLQVSID